MDNPYGIDFSLEGIAGRYKTLIEHHSLQLMVNILGITLSCDQTSKLGGVNPYRVLRTSALAGGAREDPRRAERPNLGE
jgi:hypothetical protein